MTAEPRVEPSLSRGHWLVPAALLAGGTAAVWIGDLDRAVARLYFVPIGALHWPTGYAQPWAFLYRWGVIPAIVLAACSLIALAVTFRVPLPGLRRASVLILLSLAVGPLLLVNGVLHETWGRPRPRQVVEFSGTRSFRPVLVPISDRQAQSFPTGHAAGGFSLFALYFALRGIRPRLAIAALLAALILGGVTGWARIVQGGHWLSDGLWSAGIVWFSAWAVAWLMERHPPDWAAPASTAFRPRPWGAWICLAAAAALCTGYLAFLPIQARAIQSIQLPTDVHALRVVLAGPPAEVHEVPLADGAVRLTATLSGRGFPWTALTESWEADPPAAGVLHGVFALQVTGYRPRQNLEVWIEASSSMHISSEPVRPR